MKQEKTTDLKILRKHPNYFTWGAIAEFYDFGPYTICKFKRPSDEVYSYNIWINGKDLHIGYNTLDQAIIAAVAYGNLEQNTARWMTSASLKLLGIE